MVICVLKQILHKKKSIFMQLLESPIPPLTATALRMFICKSVAPHFDNHEKGMKNVKESNFNEKKDQYFHICLRSGPTGLTPPPYGQPDRKILVF